MDRVAEVPSEEARAWRNLGRVMFLARWIMAPIYIGLLASLCIVVVKFVQKLLTALPGLLAATTSETILAVLTLVDLTLVGNLVVIVMYSGWHSVVAPLLRVDAGRTRARSILAR